MLPLNTESPETAFRPRGPLRYRCEAEFCDASPDARFPRCTGCNSVRYCSRDHQALDRPNHKRLCKKIKKTREAFAVEDEQLKRTFPEGFQPLLGQMWTDPRTHDYMAARFDMTEEIRLAGTLDGVEEALDHMQEMLRMTQRDEMALHRMIPALLTKLDRDQEAHDFITWWVVHGTHGEPYDDSKQPEPADDPLRATQSVLFDKADTISIANTMLLKFKFLVDIRNIKVVRKVLANSPLPPELYWPIELAAIRSPVCKRLVKQPDAKILRVEALLLNHIHQLSRALWDKNPSFMHALFYPTLAVRGNNAFTNCNEQQNAEIINAEIINAIHFTYSAWWETVGVMELLQMARDCGSASAAEEVEEMKNTVGPEAFKAKLGEERDEKAFLEDMGTNRIFIFLELATKDYAYLGEPDDRPSERVRKGMEEASARVARADYLFEAVQKVRERYLEDGDSDEDGRAGDGKGLDSEDEALSQASLD